MQPGEHSRATADGCFVTETAVDLDGPLDRLEGFVDPVDEVRRRPRLLQHRCLLGQRSTVDERRNAAVVGVGLTVRFERRRTSCGDERVVGDDVDGAGRLGVVDDVGGVGVGCQQRRQELGMQSSSRGDGNTLP